MEPLTALVRLGISHTYTRGHGPTRCWDHMRIHFHWIWLNKPAGFSKQPLDFFSPFGWEKNSFINYTSQSAPALFLFFPLTEIWINNLYSCVLSSALYPLCHSQLGRKIRSRFVIRPANNLVCHLVLPSHGGSSNRGPISVSFSFSFFSFFNLIVLITKFASLTRPQLCLYQMPQLPWFNFATLWQKRKGKPKKKKNLLI